MGGQNCRQDHHRNRAQERAIRCARERIESKGFVLSLVSRTQPLQRREAEGTDYAFRREEAGSVRYSATGARRSGRNGTPEITRTGLARACSGEEEEGCMN